MLRRLASRLVPCAICACDAGLSPPTEVRALHSLSLDGVVAIGVSPDATRLLVCQQRTCDGW